MKVKRCTFTNSEGYIHYATPYRVGEFISFTGLWAFFSPLFLYVGVVASPWGEHIISFIVPQTQ